MKRETRYATPEVGRCVIAAKTLTTQEAGLLLVKRRGVDGRGEKELAVSCMRDKAEGEAPPAGSWVREEQAPDKPPPVTVLAAAAAWDAVVGKREGVSPPAVASTDADVVDGTKRACKSGRGKGALKVSVTGRGAEKGVR